MLCAACNRAVNSRFTLALGKTWHTYHFTCFVCRVVLQAEDEYHETAGGVTCKDCNKAKTKAPNTNTSNNSSSSIQYDTSGSQFDPTVPRISIAPAENDEPKASKADTNGLSHASEADPQMMYSESFYRSSHRSNRLWLEDRASSSSALENLISRDRNTYDLPAAHSDTNSNRDSDAQSDACSDTHSDALSDNLSDAQSDSGVESRGNGTNYSSPRTKSLGNERSGSNNEPAEDFGGFSSEFYKRSYYYRKTLSLDSVEVHDSAKATSTTLTPTPTPLDRTPNPSPTPSTGLRGVKRLSKYGKIQILPEPLPTEGSSPAADQPKQFSDAFYKRPQNPKQTKHKRFDFEYRDTSTASENGIPTPDVHSTTNTLYNLTDDDNQALLSATLLDTSEDMKARSRHTIGTRKPPPSMSIRVVVPAPHVMTKKHDPPAPTSSPSPPLSLPSSPSPPSSPKQVRKPLQQPPYTSSPFLQVPTPIFSPPVSGSASPPLSLPAVPTKDTASTAQQIRAKIEEEVIRSVLDNSPLSSNSDIVLGGSGAPTVTLTGTPSGTLGSVSIGSVTPSSSSSSLMARKRRLKQTQKEATLQRQLSLHKHLVVEVVAANGGAKLRKATPMAASKSARRELADSIRSFSISWLRKATIKENVPAHTQHMRAIKEFAKSNSKQLRQVVGNTTASALLPTMTNLVWKGKSCFGVTFRDIQFLLRDPFASKDICSRLADRYRPSTSNEGASQIGEVDCIVAIPHEAAISFASRLSVYLQVPLQILQQRQCKTANGKSQAKTTVNFASGRGLYAAGVETLQSRGADEYELWLTQRNTIRRDCVAVVIDDVLDNGSPLIAAMMVLRAAGARVAEMVAIVEYQGFSGREKISQTCRNIGLSPLPTVHTCLVFNDNPDMLK